MVIRTRFLLVFCVVLAGLVGCALRGNTTESDVVELTLEHDGLTRRYNLYLPSSYDSETPMPLVMALHGGGSNGAQMARLTGFNELADEMGFAVVYPYGTGNLDSVLTWNAGHCCTYALVNQIDDVGFLSTLIDELITNYAIDSERIYVTGMSNGGMMTYWAGASLADKIAGIAPVAGTIGGQILEAGQLIQIPVPSRPVPVIIFHGKEDMRVSYEGGHAEKTGETRVDLSVADAVAFWVATNGCTAGPETQVSANGNIIVEMYNGCVNGANVVLVTIVDGGHAWPGARSGLPGDPPTQDIDASAMMWEFFISRRVEIGE